MDARSDDAAGLKLALVEVLDRDGHARQAVPVWRWPVTIGRAIDCDVVLDDVHVAARHATLADGDGMLRLHVGDSVNGARVSNRRIAALQSAELPSGEIFELGGTRLRVRRASDALPAERPLASEPARSGVPLTGLVLLLVAGSVGRRWLDVDPGTKITDYIPVALGLPILLALWCLFWALGSKLFRHRFAFWSHARIAVSYQVVAAVLALLLPVAAYASGWTFLSRISGIVGAGVIWAMVGAHLNLILPPRPRVLATVMGLLFAAGIAVMLARNYQANDRLFSELYVTTLAPPALRVAPTVPTARFLDEARSLKGVLDAHTADDDAEDESWGDE